MFTHLDILDRFFELLLKLMATSMRLGECSFSLKTVLNDEIKLFGNKFHASWNCLDHRPKTNEDKRNLLIEMFGRHL